MKLRTYLFLPSTTAIAHICRSLAVAEELKKRGHSIVFAIPENFHHIFRNSIVDFTSIDTYMTKNVTFDTKNFRNIEFIKKYIDQEISLINKYKPDAVITDFRFTAYASATICNTKLFALFVGNALPYGAILPVMGKPKLLFSTIRYLIPTFYSQTVKSYMHTILEIIHNHNIPISYNSLIENTTYIVPEAETYSPSASKKIKIFYIGPLQWHSFSQKLPPWFDNITPDGKTIYLTFGSTGFNKSQLVNLAERLVKEGFRVVVTASSIANIKDFPKLDNLFVTDYLPGDIISRKVDLTVCHGGYGTLIDSINSGVPVVSVPYNPDQVLHGLRMQELGLGITVMYFNIYDIIQSILINWDWIAKKSNTISTDTILTAVHAVIHNIGYYKKNISEFKSLYPSTDGSSEAADIIEKGG